MIFSRKITGISLLFALVACIASCATHPPRTSSQIQVDKEIELAVMQQLANDKTLYSRHLEVSAYLGVVTLSGFVFEANDPAEAVRIAAHVPGVISVSNQIDLQVGGVARAQ